MTVLSVNPGIWLMMLVASLVLVLAGICIGTPGGGRLKRSLLVYCLNYSSLLVVLVVLSTYEQNGYAIPLFIEIFWGLIFNYFTIAMLNFFYAVAEKEKGLHYRGVEALCVISTILCVTVEYFRSYDETGRLWLPAIHQSIGTLGCMWFLFVSYRKADVQSTRRKRIVIVFWWLFFAIFCVYFPVTVVGEVMGWVEDKILTASFVQLCTGCSFFVAFSLLITRYNLVKVELDQVGEGIFRDIDSPVLLLSKEQMVLRSNPKADELFPLEDFFSKPEAERSVHRILPHAQGLSSNFDVTVDTRQGVKEFECTLSDVYQMDEVLGSILVFHDVTRERELARMKTEFTSTVSHELRTPLTSILGFAKLIERRFRDVILPAWTPETKKQERAVGQVTKNLGIIISESNRLTKLINDVLDISKMEAGKVDWNFAQCESSEILQQAIHATNGLFTSKPSVRLVQQLPDELPAVVADSDRIVQVIINLISNAVKFTDEGRITIAVETEWSTLVIRIVDEGMGISERDQKLVFDKYKQVGDVITDKPTGTGLGLPISKEIVEMHGGKIWVESVPGQGSTFAFSLPLATIVDSGLDSIQIPDIVAQLGRLHSADSGEDARILLIDDDPSIREMLAQTLEEEGFETLQAGDGMEGLQAVRRESPSLIILDVMMPRLNGFDCAAAIKGDPALRHIPIIMLTVVNEAQRAYGLGVEVYLTKPFEGDAVLGEVKRLLSKRETSRSVVVLGGQEDSREVLRQLEHHQTEFQHLEDLDKLQATLEARETALALVVGSDFQEPEKRLEIQKLVGARPCVLLYVDAAKG